MRSSAEKGDGENVFLMKEDYDGHIAKKIVEILQAKVYETLKIDELQDTLNYHKSYLFREFKASTGQTIMAYFVKLKISRAKKLLRESDLSVTEIAEKLSFDTPNYFSKTFKRLTGYTPLQYKKIHRK
jgi:AraC-like DNA-binding protein